MNFFFTCNITKFVNKSTELESNKNGFGEMTASYYDVYACYECVENDLKWYDYTEFMAFCAVSNLLPEDKICK